MHLSADWLIEIAAFMAVAPSMLAIVLRALIKSVSALSTCVLILPISVADAVISDGVASKWVSIDKATILCVWNRFSRVDPMAYLSPVWIRAHTRIRRPRVRLPTSSPHPQRKNHPTWTPHLRTSREKKMNEASRSLSRRNLCPTSSPGPCLTGQESNCGTVARAVAYQADVIVESAFDKLVDSDGMLDFNPDNAA